MIVVWQYCALDPPVKGFDGFKFEESFSRKFSIVDNPEFSDIKRLELVR